MSSNAGNASEICSNDDGSTTRKWSGSHNSKGSPDDEDKEYNKRLLMSLGVLLPAIAAIIGRYSNKSNLYRRLIVTGVVAWAISAEVVMGAKREAARRHADSSLRFQNKYDYSKLAGGSHNPLPIKEMLTGQRVFRNDHDEDRPNRDNLDFLNQHMEQMGKDIMMRRMDDDKGDKSTETKSAKLNTGSNDKLKGSLTQENIAQLIEKLLSNQLGKSSKTPQIVVVSPIASQLNKNVSKSSFKTKVTTNAKPKALDLKMETSKEIQSKSNSSNKKKSTRAASASSSRPTSAKSSSPASSKRKATPKEVSNKKKTAYTIRTTTKSPETNKSPKNFKTKIYEKEIDILLQKIEKLEKQQNINTDKKSIAEKVSNIELLKGKPMDIADKIKTFIAGSDDPIAESSNKNEQFEPSSWQPTMNMMPPPPPPPAIQYMPFMPPQMQYGNLPMAMPNVDGESAANQQVQQYQPNPEQYPNDQANIQGYPEYSQQQQQQYAPDPQQPNQQMGQSSYVHPNQYNPPMNNQDNRQLYPNQNQNAMQEMQPNQIDPAYSSQAYPQNYNNNAQNGENEQPKKTKPSGIFRRKFKLSSILNSVIPKSKRKPETTPKPPLDHREIPHESMVAQDSQMHSYVDRGHGGGYYEHPGTQMSFGAGPMGGGGQFKASPMGILKTLILPLLPRPRMNLNGKVVFGVVLENGVGFGKKPKTVFQHYSTGRLRK